MKKSSSESRLPQPEASQGGTNVRRRRKKTVFLTLTLLGKKYGEGAMRDSGGGKERIGWTGKILR